jgi:hypothetical protein
MRERMWKWCKEKINNEIDEIKIEQQKNLQSSNDETKILQKLVENN